MTITIFVKIRSDEMAPIRKEKEGIHHSREHCIWLESREASLKGKLRRKWEQARQRLGCQSENPQKLGIHMKRAAI